MNLFFVSLGCDKNLVDSEKMIALLASQNISVTSTPEDAEIIITKEIGGNNVLFFRGYTDSSGIIDNITLPAPTSGYDADNFQTSSTTSYKLTAIKDNYDCVKQYIINMIGDVKVLQYIKMIPIADKGETINGN